MNTPVTILSGYLGTGKTTLVNQLLRKNQEKKIAILVNEFGNLPIDEDLIEAKDENLISLAGGCICCSYGDALTETLSELGDSGKAIDHILIETSGVAMPSMVANSVALIPNLTVFGIIILVDTDTLLSLKDDQYLSDTILRQLLSADLVVMNKIDLSTADKVIKTKDFISEINSKAEIVLAEFGNLESELIFKSFDPENFTEDILELHNPEELYSSFYYKSAEKFNIEKLADFLISEKNHIIRAKGFLCSKDGSIFIIQTVGKRSYICPAQTIKECGIVVIGLKDRINTKKLAELMNGFVVS